MTPGAREERQSAILFIAVPKNLGGSNRSLGRVLDQLQGRVHRILAAPARGPFMRLVVEQELADEYLPLPSGRRLLRLVAALRIAIWSLKNRRRLLAIHAQALTGLNLAAPAAILTGVPVVVRVSDAVGSRWGRRLGPWLRRLIPELRWAAVSETARQVAVSNGLCRADEVHIIPDPVDPHEVRALTPAEREGRVVIGFLGGSTDRKGFDLLPAVISGLQDLPVVWKLFISQVRTEEASPVWQQLDRVPEGLIEVPGRLADVRRVYAECDIVFCPSRAESFCLVAAEAMVNGLPVVGSDIQPIRTLLGDEEAGLLFAVGDAEAAAAALRRLVGDPDLRRRLGEEGHRRSRALEPSVVIEQLMSLYGLPPLTVEAP